MRNLICLIVTLLIVISNGFIGHYFPPKGITFTPVVISATCAITIYCTNFKLLYKSVLVYLFIALNDISIKLYSGGSHDNEGLGWIILFMFIGLVPAFVMLLIEIITKKNETISSRTISGILFVILISLHLHFLKHLGIGMSY